MCAKKIGGGDRFVIVICEIVWYRFFFFYSARLKWRHEWLIIYKITAVLNVETDIITNITASPMFFRDLQNLRYCFNYNIKCTFYKKTYTIFTIRRNPSDMCDTSFTFNYQQSAGIITILFLWRWQKELSCQLYQQTSSYKNVFDTILDKLCWNYFFHYIVIGVVTFVLSKPERNW